MPAEAQICGTKKSHTQIAQSLSQDNPLLLGFGLSHALFTETENTGT